MKKVLMDGTWFLGGSQRSSAIPRPNFTNYDASKTLKKILSRRIAVLHTDSGRKEKRDDVLLCVIARKTDRIKSKHEEFASDGGGYVCVPTIFCPVQMPSCTCSCPLPRYLSVRPSSSVLPSASSSSSPLILPGLATAVSRRFLREHACVRGREGSEPASTADC